MDSMTAYLERRVIIKEVLEPYRNDLYALRAAVEKEAGADWTDIAKVVDAYNGEGWQENHLENCLLKLRMQPDHGALRRYLHQFLFPALHGVENGTPDTYALDKLAMKRGKAGFPKEFLRMTWDDVEPRRDVTGFSAASRLALHTTVDSIRDGKGLLFTGSAGVGKTMLTCLAATPLFEFNEGAGRRDTMTVMYANASRFIKENKPGGDDDWVNRCYSSDLLILDDLGMERVTDFTLGEFELLISFRHDEEKATFWTSNHGLEKLLEIFGGRIVDRLRDRNEVVALSGPSYRGNKVGR